MDSNERFHAVGLILHSIEIQRGYVVPLGGKIVNAASTLDIARYPEHLFGVLVEAPLLKIMESEACQEICSAEGQDHRAVCPPSIALERIGPGRQDQREQRGEEEAGSSLRKRQADFVKR